MTVIAVITAQGRCVSNSVRCQRSPGCSSFNGAIAAEWNPQVIHQSLCDCLISRVLGNFCQKWVNWQYQDKRCSEICTVGSTRVNDDGSPSTNV